MDVSVTSDKINCQKLYYIQVPPGLEALCENELLRKMSIWYSFRGDEYYVQIEKREKGGLYISTSRKMACALNHMLKIPSRIGMVLFREKCLHLNQFIKPIKKIVKKYPIKQVEIHSKKSKLRNEKYLREKTLETLSLDEEGGDLSAVLFEDILELKLNLSGDHLHKRGRKLYSVDAPLRENLAAACIWNLFNLIPVYKIKDFELFDPCMGSGTFLTEGKTLYEWELERTFDYQLFFPKAKKVEWPFLPVIKHMYGTDINEKAVSAAKCNMNDENRVSLISCHYNQIELPEERDMILITNLPYNRRVKVGDKSAFYLEFFIWLSKKSCIKVSGILLPKSVWKMVKDFEIWKTFKVIDTLEFSNGGIPVQMRYIVNRETGLCYKS